MNHRQQKNKKIYKTEDLEYFLREFLELQTKETTRKNYELIIKDFILFLKINNVAAITQDNAETNIKLYRSKLQKLQELASSSIDNYTLRVQSFNSYLGFNTKIKKLNSSRTKKYKYLTINEIQLLLTAVPSTTNNKEIITRNKAIILALFSCGLRVQELCNIRTGDLIKENGKTYFLIHGKGRATDETEKIAITQQLQEAIKYYIHKKKIISEFLFSSIHGNQLTRQNINRSLKKIAAETDEIFNTNIKPRCSSHCFRHSLARYLLVDKKQPISLVKDILRHSSIETTAKYLTNSEDEITELRETIIL